MVLGHYDAGFLIILIQYNTGNLGGTQGICDVANRVIAPYYYVNFFLFSDFTHNSVHAGAMSTNEGTYWINAWHRAHDSNFAANTWLACDIFYRDGTSLHLRHLGLKKPLNKFIAST